MLMSCIMGILHIWSQTLPERKGQDTWATAALILTFKKKKKKKKEISLYWVRQLYGSGNGVIL